jgi:excisionase family DNA binding protein
MKRNGVTLKAVSIEEITQMLPISKNFVRAEIRRGRLQALRLGRRIVIPIESLNAWLGQPEGGTK